MPNSLRKIETLRQLGVIAVSYNFMLLSLIPFSERSFWIYSTQFLNVQSRIDLSNRVYNGKKMQL
ncbi:Uncharacterised protein [Vibrio cholerae]|nr:Uncharacterised protein [Vibrio cholerae]CSD30072.1 Uncharacterised protein [Vibrio cholerae]